MAVSTRRRRRLSPALADLEEATVRVAEERPDLPRIVDRLGEECRAAGDQLGVSGVAVGDRDDELGTWTVGIGRRRHRHGRLVGGWCAAGHEQEPGTDE